MSFPAWFSTFADVVTVVGFLITVAVFFQTRAIRKSFTLRGRLPEASTTLKTLSAELLKGLTTWPESESDAQAALARIHAVVINLMPKVSGPERAILIKVRSTLRTAAPAWKIWHKAVSPTLSKDEAWEVYYAAEGLITSIEQLIRDSQWA